MSAAEWAAKLRRGRGRGRRTRARANPGGPHNHAAPGLRARGIPRPLVIAAVIGLLLVGAWMWVRDSSLVAVRHVVITGVTGPNVGRIRSALTRAARNMTTLDVRMDELQTAVAPYPVVKNLEVTTGFPHSIRIRVIEEVPVGVVSVGGRSIAVAGDGTLLHGVPGPGLPTIPMSVPPGGTHLSDTGGRGAVAVLAAAPYQMLSRVSAVTTVAARGLALELRAGPTIYFGDDSRLAAKWVAAIAVLADSGSAGAAYLDVSDPGRPVAGGGSDGPAARASATAAPPAAGASARAGTGAGAGAGAGAATGAGAAGAASSSGG